MHTDRAATASTSAPYASPAESALPETSRTPIPPSRYIAFAVIAIVGCAVDLSTKSWIFGRLGMPDWNRPPLWIWRDVFSLTTSLNEGALFGMGQGMVHVFALLSVVAAAGILYWLFWAGAARDRLLTVALGAITAGIFGNLYDRLGMPRLIWPDWHPRAGQPVYAVRDWLHFKIEGVIDWPVFNIADSLLVCGAALLFWQALRQSSAEKRGQ